MNMNDHTRKLERGQSLVEFTFGAVILIILVVGIFDVGRALFTYMALRESAQEGALIGSVNPTDQTMIKNRVMETSEMVTNLITADDILVEVLGTACTGNGIRVTVTYTDFPITTPFLGLFIGSQTITLSTSATDTILTPPCE